MNVNKIWKETTLFVEVEGRIDTITAPKLEAEIKNALDSVTALIWDFKNVEYISSAGLRVLLASQKTMNKKGSMVIKNVRESVNEVFEVTGFLDILTIE